EKFITDQKKRTHRIGRAIIKEIRGGTEEHPEGLGTQAIKLLFELVPEFSKITKIDIKSCYANIMRDYPLPCGSPELVTDPQVIGQKLKEGKEGFVSFYARQDAVIKNNQIPFLPDSDDGKVRTKLRPYHFLHTKLLKVFNHQYDKFLNYCKEIKKVDEKKGKMLINSLNGYLGKNNFGGYHYHPFNLAVINLAILKAYYLYRQFLPQNVLAIRSDCIYVKGELPEKILKQADKHHITKYQQVTFFGEENIFIHDTQELKARLVNDPSAREKLIWKVKTILQGLDQELKNSCQKAGCPPTCRQIPTLPQRVLTQLKIMENQDD
ncbi:15699_t:CDS:2, partial [Racocetra fulgida]